MKEQVRKKKELKLWRKRKKIKIRFQDGIDHLFIFDHHLKI